MCIGPCLGVAAVIDCEMTLQGFFLGSVKQSEISVTVSGELCTERQRDEDSINTASFYPCTYHSTSTINYILSLL